MKVQFEAGRVRLRATRAQLQSLRSGEALRTSLGWPGGGWCVEVRMGDAGSSAASGRTLRIAFSPDELAALDARLPTRDGLQRRLELPAGAIDVRFEVDLHDGRARPR
jgi:hypothetical protein